jgi:hypothetical protein
MTPAQRLMLSTFLGASIAALSAPLTGLDGWQRTAFIVVGTFIVGLSIHWLLRLRGSESPA